MGNQEYNEWATAKVNLSDGREIEANRYNTSVFTFLGNLAVHNHIFIVTDENAEEESMTGVYIFADTPGFNKLAHFCVENMFPQHVNLTEVAECDQSAYAQHVESNRQQRLAEFERQVEDAHLEIPDFLPEDFK